MSDYIDCIAKMIKSEYPLAFEDDVTSSVDEYWSIYFNPDTFEVILGVECGDVSTYASPECIAKVRDVIQGYYMEHFGRMLDIVADLVRECIAMDVMPDSVIVPEWIVEKSIRRTKVKCGSFGDIKMVEVVPLTHIYGIKLLTHGKDVIRVESSLGVFREEYTK